MKTIFIKTISFLTLVLSLVACSDSDNNEPQVDPNELTVPYFDIWVTIGEHSGMGSKGTRLVYSTKQLQADQNIDFKGKGIDVTAKLYQESIIKGEYYYQIPIQNDRFGKYRITPEGIEIEKEVSFAKNTYKERRYSHTWIDDNTLVVIAANGAADKVIWTKLNTNTMSILAEGTLDLPPLEKFSTSGLASYRKSDNKILYSYCVPTTSYNGSIAPESQSQFHLAFVNATDMSVENVVTEKRATQMASTAYGELMQSKSFFDTDGDYYLACASPIAGSTNRTQQKGVLLRVKNGETKFDDSYIGFNDESHTKAKIVTAEFLTNNKALLYIQDPAYTGAAGWGSDFNCYYGVLDLKTDEFVDLKLPYSSGTFTQRSVVVNDIAYIGVNPKESSPCIYTYNIKTKKTEKSTTITEGYIFDRLVRITN